MACPGGCAGGGGQPIHDGRSWPRPGAIFSGSWTPRPPSASPTRIPDVSGPVPGVSGNAPGSQVPSSAPHGPSGLGDAARTAQRGVVPHLKSKRDAPQCGASPIFPSCFPNRSNKRREPPFRRPPLQEREMHLSSQCALLPEVIPGQLKDHRGQTQQAHQVGDGHEAVEGIGDVPGQAQIHSGTHYHK